MDKYLTKKIKGRVTRFSNEEVQDLKDPDKLLTVSSDIDFTDSIKSDLCYVSPVIFSYLQQESVQFDQEEIYR